MFLSRFTFLKPYDMIPLQKQILLISHEMLIVFFVFFKQISEIISRDFCNALKLLLLNVHKSILDAFWDPVTTLCWILSLWYAARRCTHPGASKTSLVLVPDIRETAFVSAITAAGVTHAVTQACSMGELPLCDCAKPQGHLPAAAQRELEQHPGRGNTAWEWGGCGDDVQFGYAKSRQFMDAHWKKGGSDIRTQINLHNNEAGRLVSTGSAGSWDPYRVSMA